MRAVTVSKRNIAYCDGILPLPKKNIMYCNRQRRGTCEHFTRFSPLRGETWSPSPACSATCCSAASRGGLRRPLASSNPSSSARKKHKNSIRVLPTAACTLHNFMNERHGFSCVPHERCQRCQCRPNLGVSSTLLMPILLFSWSAEQGKMPIFSMNIPVRAREFGLARQVWPSGPTSACSFSTSRLNHQYITINRAYSRDPSIISAAASIYLYR